MAAVLEKPDRDEAAAMHDSQVEEQLAQATSRIRAHDLTFGGLVLFAFVLIYATTMIMLDKYLNLPEWVRQTALTGFVVTFAGLAYLTLFSPLRKRINPLYAAKQVERTIDDAKNSVTGYVDAQQKGDLNPTVKAALANRAAKAAAEADVNRAIDHRGLVWLGGVAIAFLLALVVLFFAFRPPQFASLAGRTFVPFTSTEIVSQTQLELVKPEPLDPTITTGQSVTVSVHVGGKVPKADGLDKVRLMIRHNLADPDYEELPMVQGASSRDWELRVPDYLVQNGFWYKVAGGDATTEEHRVTVRSLPMFTDFTATYEYPAYLRREREVANDPVISAYRGTTVTLVAKANRELREGVMEIQPGNVRIAGAPIADKPDSLRFQFKVTESGKYVLAFLATNGERSANLFSSTITLKSDQAPIVSIIKPEEEEVTVPANGQIVIDGKIGDDFGIDTVTLKMKLVEPVQRPLPDVPYLNDKSTSFRRDGDKTYPTNLDYKGSVDLAKLKKDAAGLDLQLDEKSVIEVWLEATDNCTEPKPNVGKSAAKRVRLTAPKTEQMDQQNLDQQKEERKNEEKKHNDQQQEQLKNEPRDQQKNGKPQPKDGKPDGNPEPKPGDKNDNGAKNPNPDPKKPENNGGMGMNMNPSMPEGPKNPPDPKVGGMDNMGMGGMPPPAGMTDPTQPKNDTDPKSKNNNDSKGGNPDSKQLEDEAKDLKKELDRQNKSAGEGKPNPSATEKERTDPAQPKPQPPGADMGDKGAAEQKPEPKQPNPNDPMQKNKSPSESKDQGDLKKPQDAATPKPQPQPNDPNNKKNTPPADERNSAPPVGGSPGTEKDQPPKPQPQPNDPNKQQDPTSGATGKPATEKKDEPGAPNSTEKKDPAAGAAGEKKPPVQDPTRGEEKPAAPEPKTKPTDPKGTEPKAGDGKPNKAPAEAETKPMPTDPMMNGGMNSEAKPENGANDPKATKPNATGAAETKPDDKKPMGMGGDKSVYKGGDKPKPEDKANGGGNAPMPKEKLDEKQMKELQDAAKDLAGNDEAKKQAARDKLDKTVGEDKRKELEQLADDLKSPDKNKREAAEKKINDALKDMKDNKTAGKEPPKKGDNAPKFDDKTKQEIENAIENLQNPDMDKQREAREKLDKTIGEDKRKELEQAMKVRGSDDPPKQNEAAKKIQDFKDQLNGKKDTKEPQPDKKPTPEEINDLAKKAQDLNSDDADMRRAAEKELDDKIGEQNRKKLQEEMKNAKMGMNPPKSPEDLKKQLEEWREGLGHGTEPLGQMERKKKELETAELQLEEFNKEKNREAMKKAKGWTDDEWKKWMDDYNKYVGKLRDEVNRPVAPSEAPMPKANYNPGGGGTVTGLPGNGGTTTTTAPTAAPPGFEDATKRFQAELNKKKP
jgi:hypothetical protein